LLFSKEALQVSQQRLNFFGQHRDFSPQQRLKHERGK